MPLQATSGAASYDGFGGGVPFVPTYIEEVFSTYLYTGNDSTQTITNGIDLAGNGGLIWLKKRNNTSIHGLWDTARGGGSRLSTESTSAAGSVSPPVTFNSNGFTLLGGSSYLNESSANTYASWTFRKQPKFFDVVTWTGDGNATKTISHNLGSAPGCIMVKLTSGVNGWDVYHRSLGTSAYVQLNTTAASTTISNVWGTITSTTFTATGTLGQNDPGATYVAYLFAHDAGGFGLSGSDNVISCGSFTTDGSGNATVSLGYEPQWILVKNTQTSGTSWVMLDNMRGWTMGNDSALLANLSNAENTGDNYGNPTATGFYINNNGGTWAASNTHIYIAIRRGPMKTPTTGTSVFSPVARSGNSTNTTVAGSSGVSDLAIIKNRNTVITQTPFWASRLTANNFLLSSATDAQSTAGTAALQSNPWDVMSGIKVGTGGAVTVTNASGQEYINYLFTRAPGFFDVVCYSGTSAARTVSHNLGVAPELMIVKARSGSLAGNINWFVYAAPLGNSSRLLLDTTGASADGQTVWNNTTPTSSVFSLGTSDNINGSGYTYVAYLFASVTGISKVGSYTGTGTTKQIDCGFTGGARWVMIKRTDSTGDWYVWDSARGIVAGNDPYLLLNSTAAEVTNTDYVDTYSAGFEISSTAPAAINANGGSFVFLAIA